jgi:hypothetical protein
VTTPPPPVPSAHSSRTHCRTSASASVTTRSQTWSVTSVTAGNSRPVRLSPGSRPRSKTTSSVQGVTHDAVVGALIGAGWQVIGERAGVYKRLAVVDGYLRRIPLLVPVDPAMADYADLMDVVLGTLERLFTDGESARQVLDRIRPGVAR